MLEAHATVLVIKVTSGVASLISRKPRGRKNSRLFLRLWLGHALPFKATGIRNVAHRATPRPKREPLHAWTGPTVSVDLGLDIPYLLHRLTKVTPMETLTTVDLLFYKPTSSVQGWISIAGTATHATMLNRMRCCGGKASEAGSGWFDGNCKISCVQGRSHHP